MEVYIVQGRTGEYADRTQWVVACYLDRDEAERHVALLQDLAGDGRDLQDHEEREALEERLRASGLDRRACVQYTGVRYGVASYPLSTFAPDKAQPPRRPSPLAAP